MPTIELTEETYEKLASFASGFETPEDVVKRIASQYKTTKSRPRRVKAKGKRLGLVVPQKGGVPCGQKSQ